MNKLKDNLTKIWIISSIVFLFLILFFIFVYVINNGSQSITFDFIMSKPSGSPIGKEGGIFPAIIGTLQLGLIATMSALVLSLLTSIYIKIYCKNNGFILFIRKIIGIMNGIPSIVLGLFGYSFFVIHLRYGISLLSAGLVLGLMIFPNMEIRFEKVFEEVELSYKMAAYSLGVNELYYIVKILLPISFRKLLSIVTLSTCYAMGATAPIMLTGAVYYSGVAKSVFSPIMALPVHIYMLLGESISIEKAFATASILLILLLSINIISFVLILNWRDTNE